MEKSSSAMSELDKICSSPPVQSVNAWQIRGKCATKLSPANNGRRRGKTVEKWHRKSFKVMPSAISPFSRAFFFVAAAGG